MIKWPPRAFNAIVKLFEPLQDIDVYVEDSNDEVFYTYLLKRIVQDSVRIAKVFSMGNRSKVIECASMHDVTKRRALFLIDGDLEWVRGEPSPGGFNWLYRIEAYCIENLLVSELPAVQVLMEEMVLLEEDAKKKLAFSEWVGLIQSPLVELFAAYATVSHFDPTYRTVSSGVGNLCVMNRLPYLDPSKVALARDEALLVAKQLANPDEVLAFYNSVVEKANKSLFPLDVVSGKDHLLPLLDFALRQHKCCINRKTLRFKLALKCDLTRFVNLKAALVGAVR